MAGFVKKVIESIKDNHKFLKFIISNGAATVVNFALYVWLYRWMNVHYIMASVVSYIIALILSYILNKVFVFETNRGTKDTIVQYVLIKVGLGVVSNAMLYVAVSIVGIRRDTSWIITTGIIFLISYIFSKKVFETRV